MLLPREDQASLARKASLYDTGCGFDLQLEILPELASTLDPVCVVAGGVWLDSCVPKDASKEVADAVVRVRVDARVPPGTYCLTVLSPWESAVDVGRMPEGNYEVQLFIACHAFPDGVLCASQELRVYTQVYLTYLPVASPDLRQY